MQDFLDAPLKLHPMLQRARRMKRHLARAKIHGDLGRDSRPFRRDHLDRVARKLGDFLRLRGVTGIEPQQMTVVLDHHTAAACGDDDRLHAAFDIGPPGVDIALDDVDCALVFVQMVRQRAAAAASGNANKRNADTIEHSSHRRIDNGGERALHAVRGDDHPARMPRLGPAPRGQPIRNAGSQILGQNGLQKAAHRKRGRE